MRANHVVYINKIGASI
ncbi:hypothetical protein Zm00014a_012946 [Zea mays]|uniref:Uncharacterized protein n=1 Tax=Zea mays TaxID=4577 RepID=A0A3L6F4D9_MAIZE|nr:hypothetical protein Zm00014a_012946 [Zea mays]